MKVVIQLFENILSSSIDKKSLEHWQYIVKKNQKNWLIKNFQFSRELVKKKRKKPYLTS